MSYLIPDLVRVESCCARAVGLLYRRAAIVTFYHQVFPLESQEGATVSVGKKKCCLSFQAVFEKTYQVFIYLVRTYFRYFFSCGTISGIKRVCDKFLKIKIATANNQPSTKADNEHNQSPSNRATTHTEHRKEGTPLLLPGT